MKYTAKELREMANENGSNSNIVLKEIEEIIVKAAQNGENGVMWTPCLFNMYISHGKCFRGIVTQDNHKGSIITKTITPCIHIWDTQAVIRLLKDNGYDITKKCGEIVISW